MTDYETQGLIEEARECHQARGWSKDPLVNKLENLANRLANALEAAGAERDAAVAAIERVRAIHKVKHGERPRYAADDYHAEREPVAWEKYSMCEGCSAMWPCATIAALDGAPEPEWEYQVEYRVPGEETHVSGPMGSLEEAQGFVLENIHGGAIVRRTVQVMGEWEPLPVGGESK